MPQTLPESDWKQIDRKLRQLARRRAEYDHEEGRWLLAARRRGVHRHLGFASVAEYIERVFGYDRRSVVERLRVAEALETLPALAEAGKTGALCWSALHELTRIAGAETERRWLAFAQGKTVRQLEQAVSGLKPGDSPDDRPDNSMRPQVLRLELDAETWALFGEAVVRLRREVDEHMSDEMVLAEMARRVLGGPKDDGRSPYQLAVRRCDDCERMWQPGRRGPVEVSPSAVERIRCDAVVVDANTHVGAAVPKRAAQTIPPATRRQVIIRDGGRCAVPGCGNRNWLEVHHVRPRSEGGDHDPDGLTVLCGTHHKLHHDGFLRVDGTASTGLSFRHADGTVYGGAPEPAEVELRTDALSGLRSLGYKQGQAQRLLDAAVAGSYPRGSVQELIKAALRVANSARRVGERVVVYGSKRRLGVRPGHGGRAARGRQIGTRVRGPQVAARCGEATHGPQPRARTAPTPAGAQGPTGPA